MKPATIRRFDLFYLAWVALTIVDFLIQRDVYVGEVQAAATGGGMIPGPSFVTGVFVVWTLVMLLLWFLVSRKRSTIARWVIVAIVILGFFGISSLLQRALDAVAIIGWLMLVVSVISAVCLFGGGAKAWFGGKAPVEPVAGD